MNDEAERESLSLGDDSRDENGRPSKRQRNFIARQACESCRQKKTRCDEDMPCSLCKTLGIECTYAERKPTKNETSISMIFNTLRRMESKIDHMSESSTPKSRQEADPTKLEPVAVPIASPYNIETVVSTRSFSSPQSQSQSIRRFSQTQPGPVALSFSAHRTIHWPGIQRTIPSSLVAAAQSLDLTFPTQLEIQRPQLETTIQAQVNSPARDWLASLGLSCVKELSNAYFDTFNRVYPFLDRDYYFLSTLAVVVREGFLHDMESCLVLNVMALGCMGLRAYGEGDFSPPDLSRISPIVRQIMEEDIPGLSFFNEARKRVGFSLCQHDVQSAQYYLTSSIFYAQALRPVDQWIMTNRATVVCATFWKCPPKPVDEWRADMYSRLFWSSLMLDSVVVQELDLPVNGTKSLEEVVPLPKFTTYPYINQSRPRNSSDSYYHYHFLAQIAQRIILSRVKEELYYTTPSATLAEELRHQLEQWRANLPQGIRCFDQSPESAPSPADALVMSLLQSRYNIAIFHMGRPFLYKAIQNPALLSDGELKTCTEALAHATEWPLCKGVCARMRNFMPLRFFASGQMFGQLLIFNAFKNSHDPRLRDALPVGYEIWCSKMLRYISEIVDINPSISKDFELLSMLYQVPHS